MDNYCYELNLSLPILDPSFVFPTPKGPLWDIWVLDHIGFIHPDVIDLFENVFKMQLTMCHLFKGPPNQKTAIHIDGLHSAPQYQPVWAINWILNCPQSAMIWYEPISSGKVSKTHAGTAYQTWTPQDCKEISRVKIGELPVLVKNDIPHSVINLSNSVRWCVSIRTKNPMSWVNAKEFFKPYFI
jgi:hypothetical protein